MDKPVENDTKSSGAFANVGYGPRFHPIYIGDNPYAAIIEADSAFWTLVPQPEVADYVFGPTLSAAFKEKQERFQQEMQGLRFGLVPSAVYFNPTERCNLNCSYCYIPEEMRRSGQDMTPAQLEAALQTLADYFARTLPEGSGRPQVIFHGSEPMMARDAVFQGIERFKDQFRFGIQTNATLLEDSDLEFIRSNGVSLGLSLDAHQAEIADQTRHNWQGTGFFPKMVNLLDKLAGYPNYSVICTVTQKNVQYLTEIVDFFHEHQVQVAMLNPVRCTLEGGRAIKPDNLVLAENFIRALDRTYELYQQTGRKLVIANFANVLVGVVAPVARRLMCDISPCGGGRCFFALSAKGDLFPCSEFIGLPEFKGGNLYNDKIEDILQTPAFKQISGRKVEDIEPCRTCDIRHFCGAPCPAEVYTCNQTLLAPAPYCEFYEEQVRYAFRVIAADRVDAYLWEGWQNGTEQTFAFPH
jgi:uncharacterized protein